LLASFEKNVWAWRFRCMNCHAAGTPQGDKTIAKHGAKVAWTKRDGSDATMNSLLAGKLIDFDTPEKSKLLTKPLGEDHQGGVKFVVGDQGYQGFRAWLEDVAAIRKGAYARAADLPADPDPMLERFGTEIWFKLHGLPAAWGGKLLRVDLHPWNEKAADWDPAPIATSDRQVAPKQGLWQHTLTLLAERDSHRAAAWRGKVPAPPVGRYRVRVFVDQEGKLARNWQARLSESDYVGAVEFNVPRWRAGYGGMTDVDGSKLAK
ncbi:MAG TPA: hypothetical protein VNC50_12530, partial [Planctomycetia bacterium]|nr:hypothetical protein [Planctomycetia bacterium]